MPIEQIDDLGAARWETQHAVRAVVEPDSPGGLPVDLLLEPRPDSDVLVVSMHGSTDRQKYVPPRFEWLTSLRRRRHNVVCLADTTLGLSQTLELGWYLGTEGFDLTARIAEVLDSIRAQLRVRRTIVLGSSGGGFAAAQLAHRMPDTLGIAFSPQVRLSSFYHRHCDAVRAVAFPHADGTEEWERRHRDRVDLSHLYRSAQPLGYLWFVQNTADPHHVAHHRGLFEREVGTACGRVTYFDLPYGDGHVPPRRQLLLAMLDAASAGPWDDLL